jgi:hypothetical protein
MGRGAIMGEHGEAAIGTICLTILIILFAGTPDLMDAIIGRLCK